MTRILGKPFTYVARPPEEFLRKALAAGSNAAYLQSPFENYVAYSTGKRSGVEEQEHFRRSSVDRPHRLKSSCITIDRDSRIRPIQKRIP